MWATRRVPNDTRSTGNNRSRLAVSSDVLEPRPMPYLPIGRVASPRVTPSGPDSLFSVVVLFLSLRAFDPIEMRSALSPRARAIQSDGDIYDGRPKARRKSIAVARFSSSRRALLRPAEDSFLRLADRTPEARENTVLRDYVRKCAPAERADQSGRSPCDRPPI